MRLIDAEVLMQKIETYLPTFSINPNKIVELVENAPKVNLPHGECKTCKHYVPYRDQFSDGPRGDGYCKSTITTSEGQAYINCHDEWYCANYEKEGDDT